MEQNFQTSFIPKKPILEEHDTRVRSVGFFAVFSIFILFTVLLATGGLYLYKINLVKNIADKEKSLILAQNEFTPSKITELKLLNKRLSAANEILSRHIAVTPIFQALSALTMKTVRFTQFSYSFGNEKDAKNTKIIIRMSGQTVGYGAYSAYASLALQSDLFSTKDEGKNFINPVFSNLTLDDKGNVLFDLEFSVDPSFVNYKQNLETTS